MSNLTVDDGEFVDLINILSINRRIVLIADSDKGAESSQIRPTKLRIKSELSSSGGLFWLTHGREIENYYSHDVREMAVKRAHPSATRLSGAKNRFGKPLSFIDEKGKERESGFDKMKIAKYITDSGAVPSQECLVMVDRMIDYIRGSNR